VSTIIPRNWSGILFTMLQVHLQWASSLNFWSPQGNGMDWMEEEGANEGMLRQYLTKGIKRLGKEGKWNWAEFHCSYAWMWNETPTHPFIWQKDGYLVGWQYIASELVGKPPIAREFQRIPYNLLIFATFARIRELFSVQQVYVRGLPSM